MFTLDHIVPWGRSFDEYRRMFALSEADAQLRMLGCADGPASFNAEGTGQPAVTSCRTCFGSYAERRLPRND